MAKNLFLAEARARQFYRCEACGNGITKGTTYFRHDPMNVHRTGVNRVPSSHWCTSCISASGAWLDPNNGRLRVSVLQVLSTPRQASAQMDLPHIVLGQVELIGIGQGLSPLLEADPTLVHTLSPGQFQRFLCERLDAMGFEPQQVGDVYRKDGGLDILFWPRRSVPFPFLGAVQAKHHQHPAQKEGPSTVREFAAVVSGHPISIGLLVTNSSFTADAHWFARNKAPLVRLRDFTDIRRWLVGNFSDADEWRDLPESIEVCPGVVVPIGGPRRRPS